MSTRGMIDCMAAAAARRRDAADRVAQVIGIELIKVADESLDAAMRDGCLRADVGALDVVMMLKGACAAACAFGEARHPRTPPGSGACRDQHAGASAAAARQRPHARRALGAGTATAGAQAGSLSRGSGHGSGAAASNAVAPQRRRSALSCGPAVDRLPSRNLRCCVERSGDVLDQDHQVKRVRR
jgi:hypothetical protein